MMDGVSTPEIIGSDVFFEIVDPAELEYTYRLRPARDFGATFNASFKLVEVALVPTQPKDGCTAIRNWDEVRGSVALVERGECSFIHKAIEAEKAGALAIIITDSDGLEDGEEGEEVDYYIEMVDDNTERESRIPAGFLLGKNGRIIRRTLQNLDLNFAIINIPVNLTFVQPHQINHPPWLGW